MVTRDLQERFGRVVAGRREELGLSRPDVREAGGPSVATLARVEIPRADTALPSPMTLRLLDTGLRWVEGSAARALRGGEPVKVTEPSTVSEVVEPRPTQHDPLNFRLVEVDIDVVDALIAAADRCFQLCDNADLPDAVAAEARAVKAQLGIAIAGLAAAQATEVLERAGGPDREMPRHIDRLIGALLAAPPSGIGDDRENQQYRRWLAGRLTELDPDRADRFTRRWRSKLKRINLIEGEGR